MTHAPHATDSGLLYAGLEAGGTKCVCAVGTGPDDLRACIQFATTTPSETMARAVAFLKRIVLGCWRWALLPLDHLTLAPTPHLLALSPQHRSQAGPTLTWRGRSAVLSACQ